jgi:NADH dehydrogenase
MPQTKRLDEAPEPAMTEILQTPKLVVVFGGSGFLGRHVVRALARRGYRIRVPCRRPDLAGHLQPLGNVGQIQPVQANVRARWSVDRAVQGADHVVNLVGILHESGRQRFGAVHDFGARAIAEAARSVGAGMTHVSALGADARSPSAYARTKALGEKAVLETVADAVIYRPSINFGPEDNFFNRFANMARYSPVLPLIGGGHTRFQPVYVVDVAEAVARAVDGNVEGGRIYELGGPQVLTFRQCMEELLAIVDRKRLLVSVPWWLARVQASILGMLPNPVLTRDQLEQLRVHNVVSETAVHEGRTFASLGIRPQALGTILPSYLWRFRSTGQFQRSPSGNAEA